MSKKLNLQPMGTRVLIQPLEEASKTASGLLLPETATEKPQAGLIVAVGDDEEIKLKMNDKVLFAKYSGTEFNMDWIEYLLLEANDVLASVNGQIVDHVEKLH
jgi:chaperonin GroES